MDVGFGNRTGDGPGFPMSHGDGRRITTDAGSCMAVHGFGGPVTPMGIVTTIVRSGRQPMFRSTVSVAALESVSRSAAGSVRWAGFRLGPVTVSIRGGVDTGLASTS